MPSVKLSLRYGALEKFQEGSLGFVETSSSKRCQVAKVIEVTIDNFTLFERM